MYNKLSDEICEPFQLFPNNKVAFRALCSWLTSSWEIGAFKMQVFAARLWNPTVNQMVNHSWKNCWYMLRNGGFRSFDIKSSTQTNLHEMTWNDGYWLWDDLKTCGEQGTMAKRDWWSQVTQGVKVFFVQHDRCPHYRGFLGCCAFGRGSGVSFLGIRWFSWTSYVSIRWIQRRNNKAFLDWELSCSDLKSCWCFGRRVTSLVCGATQRWRGQGDRFGWFQADLRSY